MRRKQVLIISVIAVVTVALAFVILRPLIANGDQDSHDGHDHGEHKAESSKDGTSDSKAAGAHEAEKSSMVHLTPKQEADAGIRTEASQSANLTMTITLPGEIRLNEDRTAHVVPRVAGVVEAVNVTLGQSVRKGQVMAVLASTAVSEQRAELSTAQRKLELAKSTFDRERRLWEEKISAEQDYLQARAAFQEAEIAVANARQKLAAVGISATSVGGNRFEVRAPFDGMVLEKHVALGEAVREDTNLYTISDLSTVWANFNATAGDLVAVRVNAKATVTAPSMNVSSTGTVSYVGNLIGESTRTAVARVTVPNPQGSWRPGLFVSVTLVAGERWAEVTVPDDAIQSVDGKPHVFVKSKDGFAARPVEIGRSDGKRSEIVKGLQSAEEVVSANSFVLKSELEKGSAEHTH